MDLVPQAQPSSVPGAASVPSHVWCAGAMPLLSAGVDPESHAATRDCSVSIGMRATVRNLENVGKQALPCLISTHSQRHNSRGYFLVDFYASTSVESKMECFSQDIDVIRSNAVEHPLTQGVEE